MSAPIPEDLKKSYMCRYLLEEPAPQIVGELIERIAAVEAEREMWKAEASRLECDKKHIIELGERELAQARERITELEHKLELWGKRMCELNDANERLSAPVSDEEWIPWSISEPGRMNDSSRRVASRGGVDALIAARAKENS